MSSRANVPRSFGGPSERCSGVFPPKSPTAVPPRRLGGMANTCPLSSEESDGALSRSKAPSVFPRPASFPAHRSFLRITIDGGILVAQTSACGFSEIHEHVV